ncbi:ASKHA domain-containing protein [Candidatus Formimonas warabiya]|uniref:Ferredoxin n=1 Tax=Formimonas warabiya TaxID=1761012 RepID=A0A3G1KSP8_FORW1|nr:ASKHA domain-containing protein [Candidatus Formimonas warabiya]ATW25479.1 ferredoxin [Candidatus Formimonas warabiya]
MSFHVIFQPSGRRGLISAEKSLLEASQELGVDIEAPCGGAKVCGKCKVKIEEGYFEKFGLDSQMSHLSSLTEEEKRMLRPEELGDNYRLACCAKVQGDILVFVPEESRGAKQIVLETGTDRSFQLNPAVKKYYVELDPATLEDHRDDFIRLREALKKKFTDLNDEITIDYPVLLALPDVIRKSGWKATVTLWNNREIIQVEPGVVENAYGIAIDIGTTTLAAYLCNLATGEVLNRDSMMNPQVRYGEDVLSRITYAMMQEDGLDKMHRAIVEGINTMTARMTQAKGLSPEQVAEMVLVFNTAMHHIALNIHPQYVGRAPFTPALRNSADIKARDLGIKIAPGGNVHCLPIEAGFVGPDNVAVLIAEEPYKQDAMMLIIDIGTNGEIDFGNKEHLLSTSCATGPALEGAQIKFGMRAAPGAIERIKIDPSSLEPRFKVIGEEDWYHAEQKPSAKGICGSGIIDGVAELFKSGIIEPSGRFNMKLSSPRIRRGADNKPEYVLAWSQETSLGTDITITQGDVRAVQLAKSALYVGAKILMKKRGVDHVDSITLAGAFGSYIDKESALVIGMFPDCPLDKVVAVGNAAGDGAKLALLDTGKRVEAQEAANFVQFVETAVEPDFQVQFADAMYFPHAKDPFPHIQHILDAVPKTSKKAV